VINDLGDLIGEHRVLTGSLVVACWMPDRAVDVTKRFAEPVSPARSTR
jgi:hypothetical protein